MKEEWKVIPDFPRYQISNFGRVRGIRVTYLKWLYSPLGGGYPFVDLRAGKMDANGKYIRRLSLIHILVAEAFLGPRPSGMVVHHKDGDRNNPRVDNLEYVTPTENARFRFVGSG